MLGRAIAENSSHRVARLYLRNAYWGRAGLNQSRDQFEAAAADLEQAIEYDSGPSRNHFRQRLALTFGFFSENGKVPISVQEISNTG